MFRNNLTPVVFLFAAGLVAASCGSKSPTTPSGAVGGNSSATSGSSGASTSTSSGPAKLTVTVNPNPVPFDGKPITDVAGCDKRNNTWFYEQKIEESGGTSVTLTSELDMFDGFVVNNKTDLNYKIDANGSLTLNPRWCSAESRAHTAQSSFSGVDAHGNPIKVDGPVVNLQAAH